MSHLFRLGCCFLLIGFITTEAQNKSSINISSKCLGNVIRVEFGPLGGNLLDVAAVVDNISIPLTKHLASRCGFSMRTDQQGNALISASIQNCFALNVKDETFTTILQLWLHGLVKDEVYQVAETCHYTPWASREIICDPNYMEVSVKMAAPDEYALLEQPIPEPNSRFSHLQQAAEPPDAEFTMIAVVLYTPVKKVMKVREINRRGYWIQNSPTRLIVRGPRNPADAYTHSVAGVPMTVFKTSTILENKGLVTHIDAATACPTMAGSVSFSSNTITWYVPRHIDPLISSSDFQLLEVHVGLDGQRITFADMEARQFSMSVNDMLIILEIPVGAAGGFFQSHVQDNQYLISYTIEPMLELLWTEDAAHKDTRYKVLLPTTTPLMSQPLQIFDYTVPEEQVFKVMLGQFASDVALTHINCSSEVLSVTELNDNGFNLLEHQSPNSSFKFFTLEVPFTASVVHQRKEMGNTVYSLLLTFGLLVLERFIPFSHTTYLEASLGDTDHLCTPSVPPSVSGHCGDQNFYILVEYGTPRHPFLTVVGKQILTRSLAIQYHLQENETHFSFVVPFSAPDVAFESIESSSIGGRLNVTLTNPETNANIQEFSAACRFFSTLTECFPNGTMTALAVKLESVPSLNTSQLTLRDPACGPAYSDARYAYFVFTANSCGTTRMFLAKTMMLMYENKISLPDEIELNRVLNSEEPEYELKISCYYDINKSHTVAFHTRPRRSEPYAEISKGQLQVVMRLSLDNSYRVFHRAVGYPIIKYLQQPLYFELELVKATNPNVSLELENCWATLDEDRTSQPRWNLIINGCPNPVDTYQVVFHPILSDTRVQYPSHFKRFEVQMFAFADDKDDLSRQVFVHCDVAICDARNPLAGVCNGQCSNPENGIKGQRRAASDVHSFTHVSLGPVLMSLYNANEDV
ncbi:uncharacterized protein LOC114428649 [Parambassis ranga]|uniref:Uncharacterized protein LOC114428649 n=1 Tax=Parambassis ranga TaxID=210632 RepID=A0A6P7HGD9_9TELE|nr:uncharacterized protein LOC114428649 [Parambassis ranga]